MAAPHDMLTGGPSDWERDRQDKVAHPVGTAVSDIVEMDMAAIIFRAMEDALKRRFELSARRFSSAKNGAGTYTLEVMMANGHAFNVTVAPAGREAATELADSLLQQYAAAHRKGAADLAKLDSTIAIIRANLGEEAADEIRLRWNVKFANARYERDHNKRAFLERRRELFGTPIDDSEAPAR